MVTLRLVWNTERIFNLLPEFKDAEDAFLLGLFVGTEIRIEKHLENNVYLGAMHPSPLNTPEVAVKIARGGVGVNNLKQEAYIYTFWLRELQGITVPMMLGMFVGEIDGQPFACMVMEYINGDAGNHQQFFRGSFKAMHDVNKAGIVIDDEFMDRHFASDFGGRIRMLGFSRAKADHHKFKLPMPQ